VFVYLSDLLFGKPNCLSSSFVQESLQAWKQTFMFKTVFSDITQAE